MHARAVALAAGSVLALTVAAPGSADLSANQVVRLGRGMATWRIGMPLRTEPGLVRSERHRENDGPGCTAPPASASRIDYYRGIRLSWSFYGRKTALAEVATSRAGDRSGVGFEIGRSTFRQVRSRYRSAAISRNHVGRYALGRVELVVYQRTGYESGKYLEYWFDARGRLVAIATGVSGC